FNKKLRSFKSSYFSLSVLDDSTNVFYARVVLEDYIKSTKKKYHEGQKTNRKQYGMSRSALSESQKHDRCHQILDKTTSASNAASKSSSSTSSFVRIHRSHSFAGFSALYYAERAHMLQGKWTSTTGGDELTYDRRTLNRLILRSGGNRSSFHRIDSNIGSELKIDFTSKSCLPSSTCLCDGGFDINYDAGSSGDASILDADSLIGNSKEKNEKGSGGQNELDFWLICRLSDTILEIYFHE
uniref:Uncharacterized protein n=1 Tax=Romanomermis culicivorax TaxID=13658 RepID=A0A915I5L1_ROMCU